MKPLFIIYLFLFLFTPSLPGQNSPKWQAAIDDAEHTLNTNLNEEYLDFIQPNKGKAFYYFFKIEPWVFFGWEDLKDTTLVLRNQGVIGQKDYVFARNENGQFLFYKGNEYASDHKIYHLDEDFNVIFYAFSIAEFEHFEVTQQLIEDFETTDFKEQDLSPIENCVGCLYEYAFYLNTSEYDDNFSEERNARALELFYETAEKGHPSAAHEIADYYYFKDSMIVDEVIHWREKAIALGNKEDIYELADFIIDHKLEAIDRAIDLLERLFDVPWYRDRAMLKLARIYMRGTGNRLDYKKGLAYTQECAGAGNVNCYADLAFYYYKGMGVEQNTQTAYDLLVKASELSKGEILEGSWDDFIKILEKELKEKN